MIVEAKFIDITFAVVVCCFAGLLSFVSMVVSLIYRWEQPVVSSSCCRVRLILGEFVRLTVLQSL